MHYTKVPDKSSSLILSQLLRFGKKGKAGLGVRGGGLGGLLCDCHVLEQRAEILDGDSVLGRRADKSRGSVEGDCGQKEQIVL